MRNLFFTTLFTILLSLGSKDVQAEKYIIFISGYGSDIWESTGIVNDWSSLVPNGNILVLDDVLRDFPEELISNITSISSETLFEDLVMDFLEATIEGDIQSFLGNDNNVELVLVGHSIGGYIARLLEHTINASEFLDNVANIEVSAVLTIATPHQGAGVAGVSYGPNNDGLRDISSYVDDFRDDLEEPYYTAQSGIIGSWVSSATLILTGVDAMTEIDDLFGLLEDQIEYLEDSQFLGFDVVVAGANLGRLNLNEVIGYDGVFPDLLNSIQADAEIRSVFGVEKYPIPVRIADEVIGDGNEKATSDNYNQFRSYYKAEEDYWEAIYDYAKFQASLPWCLFSCRTGYNDMKDAAKRKEDLWKAGRHAIENVDDTWGEIIDSYFTETQYIEVLEYVGVCDDDGGDDGLPGPSLSVYSNIISEQDCSETGFIEVIQEVLVTTAEKNDAITAPQYGVWKASDMSLYQNRRAYGNYFYSDTESQGGYNHMELRRSDRAYNDSGNGIVKGAEALPMREARDWINGIINN